MRVPPTQIIGFYDDADNLFFFGNNQHFHESVPERKSDSSLAYHIGQGSICQDDYLLKPLGGCGFSLRRLRSETKLDRLDDCV